MCSIGGSWVQGEIPGCDGGGGRKGGSGACHDDVLQGILHRDDGL